MSQQIKKRSYIYLHKGSQKERLFSIIDRITTDLGRPVSSKDLKAYFALHPEQRPDLLKPMGQILLGASRLRRGRTPRLMWYGQGKGYNFYATRDCQEFHAGLQRLYALWGLRDLVERAAVDVLAQYRHIPVCRYALHSVGGLIDERLWLCGDIDPNLIRAAKDAREICATYGEQAPSCPGTYEIRTTNREGACMIMKKMAWTNQGKRLVSTARHLSMLGEARGMYAPPGSFVQASVIYYGRWKWPAVDDDPHEFFARFLAVGAGHLEHPHPTFDFSTHTHD